MYRDSNLEIRTSNNHVIINTDTLAYTGVSFNAYAGRVSIFGIYTHWNTGKPFDAVISTSPTLLNEATSATHHVDGHPAKIVFIHWGGGHLAHTMFGQGTPMVPIRTSMW